MIVRWDEEKSDQPGLERKEACTSVRTDRHVSNSCPTRFTPDACARHRSAFTTARSHNRQWHGDGNTLWVAVKTFFRGRFCGLVGGSSAVWSGGAWGTASVPCFGSMDRTCARASSSWLTPKGVILTRDWTIVKENDRVLVENGLGAKGGPGFPGEGKEERGPLPIQRPPEAI